MRTRVKICGLTRVEDVRFAVALGVDALGLVFYPPSPRAVTPAQAARLAEDVPAFVTLVGLFVDAERRAVHEALAQVPLGTLQFHGQEAPSDCAGYGLPWLKAIPVRPGVDPAHEAVRYAGAAALLLDTYDPQLVGGTGRRFDWDLVPPSLAGSIILAGGLDPSNVAEAIRRVRPYAVDVSGGVESSKGIKDQVKMQDFFRGVRDGDQSR